MAKPPPETRVLVLQGGGALGSYQAGVFEVLSEACLAPHWVAGISIGAINAALIAGNPPERRLERLRAFWEQVSSGVTATLPIDGERIRSTFNDLSAAWIAMAGAPGFFRPRLPPAIFFPPGSPEALSVYDTAPLRETLERLVDFELINRGDTRLSVGAVNIRTGNFAYFDNSRMKIGPEHIMASGALPPGFPPIEIDGEHYWDGGIVSNTPLQYVFDENVRQNLMIFQVDLFSARGPMPRDLLEAAERANDIRFSSRTRLNTDDSAKRHRAVGAIRKLLDQLPPEARADPDVAWLDQLSQENAVTVMQLIYRSKNYEQSSKDYEFSRQTMDDHWKAGVHDVRHSLRNPAWTGRKAEPGQVVLLDLTKDEA